MTQTLPPPAHWQDWRAANDQLLVISIKLRTAAVKAALDLTPSWPPSAEAEAAISAVYRALGGEDAEVQSLARQHGERLLQGFGFGLGQDSGAARTQLFARQSDAWARFEAASRAVLSDEWLQADRHLRRFDLDATLFGTITSVPQNDYSAVLRHLGGPGFVLDAARDLGRWAQGRPEAERCELESGERALTQSASGRTDRLDDTDRIDATILGRIRELQTRVINAVETEMAPPSRTTPNADVCLA